MKKLMLAAAFCLLCSTGVYAQAKKVDVQETDLPQAVRKSFSSRYPNSSGADWEMREARYKVRFSEGETRHLVEFNNAGEVVRTGVGIPREDMPAVVNAAINAEYGNPELGDIYRVKKDGQLYFVVEITSLAGRMVVYDEAGNVVKEQLIE
jgi:hypothetical protein